MQRDSFKLDEKRKRIVDSDNHSQRSHEYCISKESVGTGTHCSASLHSSWAAFIPGAARVIPFGWWSLFASRSPPKTWSGGFQPIFPELTLKPSFREDFGAEAPEADLWGSSVASDLKPYQMTLFQNLARLSPFSPTKVSGLLLITCSKCPGKDLNLDLSTVKPETLLQTKPSCFFSLSFPISKMGRFEQMTSGIPHCHAGWQVWDTIPVPGQITKNTTTESKLHWEECF